MKNIIYLLIVLIFFSFCNLTIAKVENFILLDKTQSTDTASKTLWNYILSETKLSETHAGLHNIFSCDCKAAFFDLNSDGVQEILGTHYATMSRNNGLARLYILKLNNKFQYENISYNIFFEPHSPIYILSKPIKGFHNIKCYNTYNQSDSTFIYNKDMNKYIDKSK